MYTVFLTILVMLIYAVPGFLLVKTKLVKPQSISAFSTFLMYVLQPCLTIDSFQRITFTSALVLNMLICFCVALLAMGIFIGVFYLITRKKQTDVTYRVSNIAVAFGNASFIGIPILRVVLPECEEVAAYSIVFFLAMSALGWTVASAIITQDKKYISAKKIFLNPATISLIVAVLLGIIDVVSGWKIPSPFSGIFSTMAEMSTPLCMVVMGFRLATADLKKLFCTWQHYLVMGVKQLVFPLFMFAILYFLPIDGNLKTSLFVMSCCPVAAVVQGYAEMIGEGQENAADMVLLSSASCVLTIPLMMLLIS
jgi:predicted permease